MPQARASTLLLRDMKRERTARARAAYRKDLPRPMGHEAGTPAIVFAAATNSSRKRVKSGAAPITLPRFSWD
jgi:hypothetical protein